MINPTTKITAVQQEQLERRLHPDYVNAYPINTNPTTAVLVLQQRSIGTIIRCAFRPLVEGRVDTRSTGKSGDNAQIGGFARIGMNAQ